MKVESSSPFGLPPMLRSTSPGFSLYIHIPYCKKKCRYCDFYSCSQGMSELNAYCNALMRQVEAWKKHFHVNQWNTVYIGGGTPSILALRHWKILQPLLDNIHSREFTLEANPESLNPQVLDLLQNWGLNRISLGLQSFHDASLKVMGRLYTKDYLLNKLEWLGSHWQGRLSFDLIYGFQGPESWVRDLRQAIEFQPEHLSLYQLSFENGTELERNTSAQDKKRILEEQDEYWPILQKILSEAGYHRYEISNYTNKEPSWHNMKYWNMDFWIGIGAGASSFVPLGAWGTHLSVLPDKRAYIGESFDHPFPSIISREKLTSKDYLLERIMMGLRCIEGISSKELEVLGYNVNLLFNFFSPWIKSGHIVVDNHRIKPSLIGMDNHNRIMLNLMDHLDQICLGLTEL